MNEVNCGADAGSEPYWSELKAGVWLVNAVDPAYGANAEPDELEFPLFKSSARGAASALEPYEGHEYRAKGVDAWYK